MINNSIGEVAVVRDINRSMIKNIRKQNLRPGIKALFYDPHTGEVLMGTLPDGYPLRFNLPGGGIDVGQMPATALCLEIEEELGIVAYKPQSIALLPVVAHAELPFEREGCKGKYEFIVAIPNYKLQSVTALPASKIMFWPVMSWQAALENVRTLAYGGSEMVTMYVNALRNVPDLLDH